MRLELLIKRQEASKTAIGHIPYSPIFLLQELRCHEQEGEGAEGKGGEHLGTLTSF